MKSAVILLSGGLDSATAAAIAKDRGFRLFALTFDYGQRHVLEISAARKVGEMVEVCEHVIQRIDLRAFGGSALTDDIEVPKDQIPESGEVPITYVPARNTVLLALLLGLAEVIGADQLFIGANEVDYSGYPDCRPAFLEAFESLASLATVAGAEHGVRFRVRAPLLELSKAEIIRRGLSLGVDYSLTWSCYDPAPDSLPCGHCDSCILRRRGFEEAGIKDPVYANSA